MESITASGHAPVNGIRMYYEIYGEGDIPLVLIHGGGSTIESSFGVLLPMLAKKRTVLAVELQAHGRTTDRDGPVSFQQDADDVAALVDYLKFKTADILGFSNGGSTALQIAIRHPKLVNKIVVVSGAYQREGFIQGFFEGMPGATIANMPADLHAAFLAVTPDENRMQTMFEKDKQRMIDFKNWPDEDLASIKAPTLFIAQDKDVMLPEHALQMSRLVPNASLVVLPGFHASCIAAVEAGLGNEWLAEITAALIDNFLG